MMFEWNDSLRIGIAEVDAQHRAFIELVNGLAFRLSRESCNEWALYGETMAGLEEYVAMHFSAEERLMSQAHYPGQAAHQARHQFFRERMEALKTKGISEGRLPLDDIRDFLLSWVIDHVMTEDKTMGEYLLEHLKGKGQG